MKFLPLFSTLLAVAAAAPLAEEATPLDIQEVQDVQNVEAVDNVEAEKPGRSGANGIDMTKNGVKILPRFLESQPKDGAKRTTVKYGTWSVSSSKMLQTTKLAKGPCGMTGCYVTAMEATIRYPDGKEANIDTNAWLHHIALFGSGGGQGSIWACGNERPTLRLNTQSKYGLDFPNAFMMMIDLMTEDTAPKSLTLEITFEHVPKTTSGYKAAAMYWLTIGEPKAKDGKYSFKSAPSISGYSGKLLYAIGHMHDGGTHMDLLVGGTPVCQSMMHYNSRAGYSLDGGAAKKKPAKAAAAEEEEEVAEEAPAPKKAKSTKSAKSSSSSMAGMSHGRVRRDGHGGHGGAGMKMEHISDPGACTDFGTVSKGSVMTSEAFYDAILHPLMAHNGKKENLMGNMRVYIGPN